MRWRQVAIRGLVQTTLVGCMLVRSVLGLCSADDSSGDPPAAQSSTPSQGSGAAGSSDQELAKKVANPISDLVSVPFQFNWQNGVGPNGDELRTVLNVQPVVPVSLTSDWNLINRWIMPYVSQNESLGSHSGLGDIVYSAFFSPAGEPSFTWGVGPVVSLPMTTDPTLGSGKWSAGPTAVVLRIQGPWVYGFLANQVWSFANASGQKRAAVNQAFLQPFLAYVMPTGWTYTAQTETIANWAAGGNQTWTVPINVLVSKITKFGPFPLSVQGGGGIYVVRPSEAPKWQLRLNFAILLPRKK